MSHGEAPRAKQDGAFASRPRLLEFGQFRFDRETLELSGRGRTVRLQPQPARLLELLIAHPHTVVSRATIRRHLWPNEVHVEYDQSMNSCVKRIRIALGDSAETPDYIQTLPRRGYRFLKSASEVNDAAEPILARGGAVRRWGSLVRTLAAFGATFGIVAIVLVLRILDSGPSGASEPSQHVLAVLPFSAVKTWSGAETFRLGLAQELVTSLGRQASDRLAVVAYDVQPFPSAEGGARGLGADYLLDGRVQRQQDHLRVWARLVRAEDGIVLWTDAYDGAESDILVFAAEVGSRIANGVLTRLTQLQPSS